MKEKEKGEKKRLKRRRECKRGLQGGEEDKTKDRHETMFQRRLLTAMNWMKWMMTAIMENVEEGMTKMESYGLAMMEVVKHWFG